MVKTRPVAMGGREGSFPRVRASQSESERVRASQCESERVRSSPFESLSTRAVLRIYRTYVCDGGKPHPRPIRAWSPHDVSTLTPLPQMAR